MLRPGGPAAAEHARPRAPAGAVAGAVAARVRGALRSARRPSALLHPRWPHPAARRVRVSRSLSARRRRAARRATAAAGPSRALALVDALLACRAARARGTRAPRRAYRAERRDVSPCAVTAPARWPSRWPAAPGRSRCRFRPIRDWRREGRSLRERSTRGSGRSPPAAPSARPRVRVARSCRASASHVCGFDGCRRTARCSVAFASAGSPAACWTAESTISACADSGSRATPVCALASAPGDWRRAA